MSPDPLAEVHALLGAATSTEDPRLRVLYAAQARMALAPLVARVENTKGVLAAVELELARIGAV